MERAGRKAGPSNMDTSKTMKFISWDHIFVVAMTGFISYTASLNEASNIRLFDAILLYGVLLANVRILKLTRR